MYSIGQTKVFPSCVRCYKEFLRWELSQKISEPYGIYPMKGNVPPSTSAPNSAVQPSPTFYAPPGQPSVAPPQASKIPPNQAVPPSQPPYSQQPKNAQGPLNNKNSSYNPSTSQIPRGG